MSATRDAYVEKLKERLDRWNAGAAEWETRAELSRQRYVTEFRACREEALYRLKLLQKASTSAWGDLAQGVDRAWDALDASFEQARAHLEKSVLR
jgi:hypothetical protein